MKVVKLLCDFIFALLLLVLLLPIFILTIIGILLSDGFPFWYCANRVGKNGNQFKMFKFRSMIKNADTGNKISSKNDQRIFLFGNILRWLKIDELPQLLNILLFNMSFIGPRPEDIHIVNQFYTTSFKETLYIRPGLASPGSIYNYTHGEHILGTNSTDQDYIKKLLPIKIALDIVYVRNQNFVYDIRIVFRTLFIITAMFFGKKTFKNPPEYEMAKKIMHTEFKIL